VTREVEVDHAWRFADATDWLDGRPPGEPIPVRVRVDARHAAWLGGFLGKSSEVEPSGDGSVVITEQVRDVAAFRSFVLTFLDDAEILDPPEVRDDMVAWLEGLAAAGGRGQL
jgi:predicted DNA-binding transcriptional regulator YafY